MLGAVGEMEFCSPVETKYTRHSDVKHSVEKVLGVTMAF